MTSSINPASVILVPATSAFPAITLADVQSHTEQAMVELVYIKEANDILERSMASLANALSITKAVLDTLTGLQNLHNQITVQGRSTAFKYSLISSTRLVSVQVNNSVFPFQFLRTSTQLQPFTEDVDAFLSRYNAFASNTFGRPIIPSAFANAGLSTFITFQSNIIAYKNALASQIITLTSTTPLLSGGIVDPNSLLANITKVYNDLNSRDLTTLNGINSWILDNYNASGPGSAKAGLIQQNLTFAIAAAQSLNDTQKQSVSNYLFLFEEYYKSASSVLQKITQLIEKMAQGISR